MEQSPDLSVITAIGTMNAGYRFEQEDVLEYMKKEYHDENAARKLSILSRQSGIKSRHSVVPDFNPACQSRQLFLNGTPPALDKRMELYKERTPEMAIGAIDSAFAGLYGFEVSEVTHLITVSCTGLYAPGLSTQLISHYGMSSDTFHTGINFMGCNAAFPALRMADMIVRSQKDAIVVVVCVELCTLHFNPKDNNDNLLANTIFADGAAAAVVMSAGKASSTGLPLLVIKGFNSLTLSQGSGLMAWDINSFNFEMVLSADIPYFIGSNIIEVSEKLKEAFDLKSFSDVKWAVHPGGKRILDAFCEKMQLEKEAIAESYEVLSENGNMSSVTILFVIGKILRNNLQGNLIAMGFGPGISIESARFFIHNTLA